MERFAKATAEGRWLLRERVRRRAGYNAWKDTLVVAYRASASLSTVVKARRLCLGNLPGYEALRQRRSQLIPRDGAVSDATIAEDTLTALTTRR